MVAKATACRTACPTTRPVTGDGVSSGSGGGGSTSYLLDDYPGAAVAYSLRKLRSDYAGACVRVRRSDSAEQNIGFSNDVLDTTALLAFCGVGDGWVTTWYDQSGNANNATQAIILSQPQIVSSGVVNLLNTKPAMTATSAQKLGFAALTTTAGQFASYWITYHKNATGNQAVFLQSGSAYHWLDYGISQVISGSTTISVSPAPYAINTQYIHSCIQAYSTATSIYRNGVLLGTSGASSGAAGTDCLPSDIARSATMTLQEFVFYAANQSANRESIESNINNYWGVY